MDRAEINRLAEDNIKLVYHVLSTMGLNNLQIDKDNSEGLSAGMLGLAKACMSFKSEKGYQFTTYAYGCIKNEILSYYKIQNYKKRKNDNNDNMSLDKEISEGDEDSFVELLESKDNTEDAVINRIELKRIFGLIKDWSDLHKKVIYLHLVKGLTCRQISNLLKVNHCMPSERVRKFKKLVSQLEN